MLTIITSNDIYIYVYIHGTFLLTSKKLLHKINEKDRVQYITVLKVSHTYVSTIGLMHARVCTHIY